MTARVVPSRKNAPARDIFERDDESIEVGFAIVAIESLPIM